jgi:hypothetical protein
MPPYSSSSSAASCAVVMPDSLALSSARSDARPVSLNRDVSSYSSPPHSMSQAKSSKTIRGCQIGASGPSAGGHSWSPLCPPCHHLPRRHLSRCHLLRRHQPMGPPCCCHQRHQWKESPTQQSTHRRRCPFGRGRGGPLWHFDGRLCGAGRRRCIRNGRR